VDALNERASTVSELYAVRTWFVSDDTHVSVERFRGDVAFRTRRLFPDVQTDGSA
jgi:hypothetical protein